MIDEKIYKKFYNLKLTKEEEEYLEGQLKRYREEKAREKEIEKTKERIRNDIIKLYDFIMPYEMADFLEEIVRIDLELDYKWVED